MVSMKLTSSITILVTVIIGMLGGFYVASFTKELAPGAEVVMLETLPTNVEAITYTERYAARIDRVDVVFEHTDFTRYKLQTNELVREGELNTERGFEEDEDATVYVLNWQKPEGEQMRYVRLTAEPGRLYMLDSDQKIIRGSMLSFQ